QQDTRLRRLRRDGATVGRRQPPTARPSADRAEGPPERRRELGRDAGGRRYPVYGIALERRPLAARESTEGPRLQPRFRTTQPRGVARAPSGPRLPCWLLI